MIKRLFNIYHRFIGLFNSSDKQSDLHALIEVIEAEKEQLRIQIAQFNENLAPQAAFVERLKRQIQSLEKKEQELADKVEENRLLAKLNFDPIKLRGKTQFRRRSNVKTGNRDTAEQIEIQLKAVKEQLKENRKMFTSAHDVYDELVKSRDITVLEARNKIEMINLEISKSEMSELHKMASGMGGAASIPKKEAEQTALADQKLAEFESAYGFASPAKPAEEAQPVSAPIAAKELGPQ